MTWTIIITIVLVLQVFGVLFVMGAGRMNKGYDKAIEDELKKMGKK